MPCVWWKYLRLLCHCLAKEEGWIFSSCYGWWASRWRSTTATNFESIGAKVRGCPSWTWFTKKEDCKETKNRGSWKEIAYPNFFGCWFYSKVIQCISLTFNAIEERFSQQNLSFVFADLFLILYISLKLLNFYSSCGLFVGAFTFSGYVNSQGTVSVLWI